MDTNLFDAFVRLIKADGYRARYRAPYRPDYAMTNYYLECVLPMRSPRSWAIAAGRDGCAR